MKMYYMHLAGSAENYEFICEDKGSLTVNKRE